ncbi:hypothetical protein V6O07_04375, partial [Arthrospira platensis SPKY2]
ARKEGNENKEKRIAAFIKKFLDSRVSLGVETPKHMESSLRQRPLKPEFQNSQKQDRRFGDDQCLGKGRRRARSGAILEDCGWRPPFDRGRHFARCRR